MTNGNRIDDFSTEDIVFIDDPRSVVESYYAEAKAKDENGEDALWEGGGLYDQGMGITEPEMVDVRLDCFRGAELLYREAASKGNPYANKNLGYVYSYDRCQGLYWPDENTLEVSGERESCEASNERAFKCFKAAADANLAEACYKLGDCYRHGTGCDIDEREAFLSYEKAVKNDDGDTEYQTGSIALRLAGCFEEGIGCEHDFKRALEYYERAEKFLEAAVAAGDSYYRGALRGASDGVTRCRQEIDLSK